MIPSHLPASPPARILVLCTGNSARSQIGEAMLRHLGGERVHAASAGLRPAERVNPYAVRVLEEIGIDWTGRVPRGIDGLETEPWDLVITVCDNAKESCPVMPGARRMVHWGMTDPTDVEGDDATKMAAFRKVRVDLEAKVRELLGERGAAH